jgi:hypothetical protein
VGSLGAALVVAYFWSRPRGCGGPAAALAPALYLCVPVLMPWAVTGRPDFPSLFCCLLAVYLVCRRPRASGAALAGLVAAAAFLIKHSAIAAPIAAVLWLVSYWRWRHAVLFCLAWGAAVGGVLAAFEVSSLGSLSLNLLPNHTGPLTLGNVRHTLNELLLPAGNGFTFLLAALGLVGLLWPREGDGAARLLRLYCAVALVLAAATSAAAGASVNYYLEPALILALAVPDALASLRRSWPEGSPVAALAFALVLATTLPALDLQRWMMLGDAPHDLSPLVTLVQGKRVLTDIPYLAARARDPELLDPVSHAYAERIRFWSSDPLIAEVRARRYDLVVLHRALDDPRWEASRYPRLPERLRAAIPGSYEFCFALASAYVYAPAPPEASAAGKAAACAAHGRPIAARVALGPAGP